MSSLSKQTAELTCKPSRFPCYAWFPTDAYYISSDDDRNTGESKKESAKKIVKQIGKRAERLIEIIAWNDASNEKDYLGAAIPQ